MSGGTGEGSGCDVGRLSRQPAAGGCCRGNLAGPASVIHALAEEIMGLTNPMLARFPSPSIYPAHPRTDLIPVDWMEEACIVTV